MKTLLAIFLATLLAAASHGQTVKALSYNVTNSTVIWTNTNALVLPNVSLPAVSFPEGFTTPATIEAESFRSDAINSDLVSGLGGESLRISIANSKISKFVTGGGFPTVVDFISFSTNVEILQPLSFTNSTVAAQTRTNLGLGTTNSVQFQSVTANGFTLTDGATVFTDGEVAMAGAFRFDSPVLFNSPSATRTNLGLPLAALTNTNNANFLSALGLGTNSSPTFSNATVTGNFTNQGTIYGLKTNVGPFEGIGNFFASNNTTVGNETLFRVGTAEATNKAAQFGYRVVRTNNGGEGFAVFSVYGYNALMMIGPSDRSRTNTATNAAIEADIWTLSESNRVATLRDTNSGAFILHQELGFSTDGITTNAPANTTNVALWLRVWVGTNNYRLPLYQ